MSLKIVSYLLPENVASWPRRHAMSCLHFEEMNRWTAMQLSEFRSLLQCSELDASSTKGTIPSSKSDIHMTACITRCHSLWWWHIPIQCVTPCHDNVSQDMKRHLTTLPPLSMKRHLKTLCHYLKTVSPLNMDRHLKMLCHYLKTPSTLAMKRHLKTLCHYLKTVSPLALKRHLKTASPMS